MADGREPLCLALVLCDGVYYDPWTGRKSLMGLLPEFAATSYPCILPVLVVHLAVSECRGPRTLTLRVVDANEDRRPVVQAELQVDSDDPLVVIDLEHTFTNLELPQPGVYFVQLYSGSTPIMERRLVASVAI